MSRPLTKSEQLQVEKMLPMVQRLSFWCFRRNRSVSRRDIEAVGREAIVVATLRHEPELGDLEAFAFSWARGEMLNYVRKTLQVRERERMFSTWIPMGLGHDDRNAGERFDAALLATPEDDRRAAVDEMTNRAAGVLAELARLGDSDDHETDYLTWRATALGHRVMADAQAVLKEPERTVCKRLFQEELTLDQIASELKVSKRTVQRIADRIRAAVANAMRAARLAEI